MALTFCTTTITTGHLPKSPARLACQGSGRGFAAWFFDYDNDGWPDLFVASFYAVDRGDIATYLGLPQKAGTMKLYRNLGNGTFRDVTKETGLDKVFMPMGANFGDVDNDGYLDIYLGTGNPSYASLLPNVLLRNKEGKSFVDVTASSGTGELHKGHGVAFADIDNDGDEDIITSIGGAMPGDSHAFRLFENPGNGNDWINLKLVGVKANRAAIGARIKVTVKDQAGAVRSIYRTVNSGGSFGASPLEQHIGLGKAAQSVSIEILWPGGSRTPQTFSNVGKNQFLEIKEFATEYTKLERRRVRLGGAKRAPMKRALLLALAACFFVSNVRAAAPARYPVTGLILSIDKPHRTFTASCSEIPGYMKAMVMPITVREPKSPRRPETQHVCGFHAGGGKRSFLCRERSRSRVRKPGAGTAAGSPYGNAGQTR